MESNSQQPTNPPIDPTPPTHISPQQKKKFPKWLIAIIGVFVLLFISAGTYATYTALVPQNEPTPTPTPAPTAPSPTPDPTPDPIADWQVYSNEEYGYQLKYPKDWSLEAFQSESEKGFNIKIISPSNTEINFYTDVYGLGGGCAIESQEVAKPKKITFFGKEMYLHYPKSNNGQENQVKSLYLTEGNVPCPNIPFFEFDRLGKKGGSEGLIVSFAKEKDMSQLKNDSEYQIVLKILSTFQFTDQASIQPITPGAASPSGSVKQCTQEAKICPDGSSVGRTGSNCQFAPCPPLTNQ